MSSTLRVNSISDAAGANGNAITLATDGTCTAKLTNTVADTNLVINPHMQINQRGLGTLTINSGTGQYPVDRWVSRGEGGSKAFTIEQVSVASSNLGVRNAIKVTSSQAATVSSSDIFNVRQMVEGYNTQRINFGESGCQSMTLSFTAYSSVAGSHSGAIQNSAQNRSYPFTYSLSANTWTDISITIPPITDGSSWNEENGVGLRLVFDMGSGDNFRGTAGQWNSAQDEGATGAVRILETNGATWYVTKVQLEEGTIKSPTQKRSVADEYNRCSRYFWMIANGSESAAGSGGSGLAPIATGNAYTSSNVFGIVPFPTRMRAAPSIYKVTGTDYWDIVQNNGNTQADDVSINRSSTTAVSLNFSSNLSVTANYTCHIRTFNSAARLGVQAEL
jgi:hypothetical protein